MRALDKRLTVSVLTVPRKIAGFAARGVGLGMADEEGLGDALGDGVAPSGSGVEVAPGEAEGVGVASGVGVESGLTGVGTGVFLGFFGFGETFFDVTTTEPFASLTSSATSISDGVSGI